MTEMAVPAGPVDIAVVGFPDAVPDEQVTVAVREAVATGCVRVLDALLVEKWPTGEVTIVDIEEPGEALTLLGFPADLPGLLTEEDAAGVADGLPAGTSAVIIAWENVWAVRLHQALHAAGAVVALHERIDAEAVAAAAQAAVTTDA